MTIAAYFVAGKLTFFHTKAILLIFVPGPRVPFTYRLASISKSVSPNKQFPSQFQMGEPVCAYSLYDALFVLQ